MQKTFLYSVYLFCMLLVITACGQKKIEEFKSLNNYTKSLQQKSINNVQKTIAKDTVLINELINFSSLKITGGFIGTVNERQTEKSADKFTLESDNVQKMDSSFQGYFKELFFEQNYINNTDIDFSAYTGDLKEKYNEKTVEFIDDNVIIENKKYYYQNTESTQRNNKLIRIDSVLIFAKIKLPIKTASINVLENVTNKYDVQIDELKENEVTLIIPIDTYKDFLAIQALNKEGKRMNPINKSSFPEYIITPSIKNELNALKNICNEILKENNEEKIDILIKKITDRQFRAVKEMYSFKLHLKELNKLKEKEKSLLMIFDFMEGFEHLFTIQNQSYIVNFSDNIKDVELFFADEYKQYLTEEVIHHEDDAYYSFENTYTLFGVSNDSIKEMGITNERGEIIIKDIDLNTEQTIIQSGNKYFLKFDRNEENDSLFWLDIKSKKLLYTPSFGEYIESVNEIYDIFKKDSGKGVVKNREITILPFTYYSIWVYDTFIAAYNRKSNLFEIYDLDFKRCLIEFNILSVRDLYRYRSFGEGEEDKKNTRFYLEIETKEGGRGEVIIDEKLKILSIKSKK
ncbi:hypothetical protein [Tenacibaculum sp. SDUM215027]|uniref:hypothetical protein n=1 Tax=Tenacibaculum sp. SDUM215027 TaxID=3422596 RepID=UPI003D316BE4